MLIKEISNALSASRQYFAKKCVFQVMTENAKTQSWVMKTVWQRIPGRRARNSKTQTTITVHSIPPYYKLLSNDCQINHCHDGDIHS